LPRISGEDEPGVQAVALTMRLIEYIVLQRKSVGVTALAEALGTTKSRISRHLHTLAELGFIAQDANNERYQVGPRLIGLGQKISDDLDIVAMATPILLKMRDDLGHLTVISQVEEAGVRVLATLPSLSPIEIGVRKGTLLHFHASAQGKAALAFCSPSIQTRVLRARLTMFTPQTIVSPSQLQAQLDLIRRQGWAQGYNETMLGVNTLAAPVFDATGRVVATVGIVDSIQFIEEQPSAEQINQIMGAAAQISNLLGGQQPRD